jgi:hypothetical protein
MTIRTIAVILVLAVLAGTTTSAEQGTVGLQQSIRAVNWSDFENVQVPRAAQPVRHRRTILYIGVGAGIGFTLGAFYAADHLAEDSGDIAKFATFTGGVGAFTGWLLAKIP